ncbi:AtpZ/AtpI family protein [Cereibacter sphaeroides]|uniref:AtpZ/AtpI family protein n=1 Tax=Cereibacter sphaeroides TaxID=1063 RepID=UPI000191CDEE|nr:AtpZ/AtpI family protein [Cereibacter sphaeroides]ACM04386.1 ATP synthase protein 1, putative [Cereibacter sphaeroides KD131]
MTGPGSRPAPPGAGPGPDPAVPPAISPPAPPGASPDPLAEAVRRSAVRAEAGRRDPEPSLARRFGQIGVLGWVIVLPTLGGVLAGGWLDRLLGTGITFAAALTMAGAALGLWLALRWMHAQ